MNWYEVRNHGEPQPPDRENFEDYDDDEYGIFDEDHETDCESADERYAQAMEKHITAVLSKISSGQGKLKIPALTRKISYFS